MESPKVDGRRRDRAVVVCETCTTPFKVSPSRLARGARFCSLACKTNGEHRTCEHCGEPFYVAASRVAKGEGRFCKLACHNAHQGRNKTDHICRTCTTPFRRSASRSAVQASIYCSIPCRDADPEWRARAAVAGNRGSSMAHPTSLESAGYVILDRLAVPFDRYYTIGGKFTVDAAYPALCLVVQFDGDYWHDRKGTSTEARIRRRVAYDDSQDAYLAAAGWRVLRYWESTVHDTPDVVAESVSRHLRLPLGDVREHGRVVRL